MLYLLRVILLFATLVFSAGSAFSQGCQVAKPLFKAEDVTAVMERAANEARSMTLPVNRSMEGMEAAKECAEIFHSPEFQKQLANEQQRLEKEFLGEEYGISRQKKRQEESEEMKIQDRSLAGTEKVYLFFSSSMPDETMQAYIAAIAQADEPLDKNGRFINERIKARSRADYPVVTPDKIDFIEVSTKQMVSAAASLIPFLEHDDANRALMGSNMQRQAVPLLRTQSPIVGTGMEHKAAVDSGAAVVARRSGVVKYVSAEKIIVQPSTRPKADELGFYEDDEYVIRNGKFYHGFCYVQLHTYDDDFHFNEDESSSN